MRAAQLQERLREFGYLKAISGAAWPALAERQRRAALPALTVLLIHRFRAHECPHLARVGRDVLVLVAKLVWEHDKAPLEKEIREHAERRCVLPAAGEKMRAAAVPALTLLLIRDRRQDECPEVARVPRDTIVAIAKLVWAHDRARMEKECEAQLEETVAELRTMNQLLFRCFERTVAWLRQRQAQDKEMQELFLQHSASVDLSRHILLQYYMPYLCQEFPGRARWSHFWSLSRTLKQNARFLIDSVYWGAQNMETLDQEEQSVRSSVPSWSAKQNEIGEQLL
jgi:hypothetical protein